MSGIEFNARAKMLEGRSVCVHATDDESASRDYSLPGGVGLPSVIPAHSELIQLDNNVPSVPGVMAFRWIPSFDLPFDRKALQIWEQTGESMERHMWCVMSLVSRREGHLS